MFPDLFRYAIITILLVMAMPMPLLGEELKLMPGLALKEEFNDNIFLSTTSRRSDFITTVTPSVDISSATERSSVSLSTGFNCLYYDRNTSLNAVDYFIQSGASYQFVPRLMVSAGGGYVQNSRPDRIDSNGVTLKSGSNRQNYRLAGNYALSEKSTSTASYSYSHEIFDNPGYETTRVHTINIGQDYDLDRFLRQAKLVGNVDYFRSIADTTRGDNLSVSVGLTKKIHELWNVSLNAGGHFTYSESDLTRSGSQKRRTDDQGWVGNFSVTYGSDYTNGSLSFNHDVIPVSGSSATNLRTGASATASERLTSELSAVIGLGYYWNRSTQNQLSTRPTDEKTMTFNGGLRYDFSEHLFLEGSYRYNTIEYKYSQAHASQNIFMLRLTMRRDLLDL